MDQALWIPIIAIPTTLIGMPWLILHYVTKWKQAPKITVEDEALLDKMYETARRLEDRLATIERIVAADNPDFRARAIGSEDYAIRSSASDYDLNRRN